MGVDTRIYYQEPGSDMWEQDDYFLGRFYDESYPRGEWPKICGRIMELLHAGNKVRYFGDNEDPQKSHTMTIERVLEISRHYMEDSP